MLFPDSSWTYGGYLHKVQVSREEVKVDWHIQSFLKCLRERKNTRSECFNFAGATWNLFASFDPSRVHSLFGINVRRNASSEMIFDCTSQIYFKDRQCSSIKYIQCDFDCEYEDSHGAVEYFLSNSEFSEFLQKGYRILCLVRISTSSIQTTWPTVKSEVYKVIKDLKQLLLSGEGSDVTIQVQDRQFRAHRSILMARSSVFAAMFRHDMKEKATGVVKVEDCEPSAFPVLLEFLYSGNTEELTVENMFSLYTCADKYDLQGFKRKCLEFIVLNLSVDTFCETVRLSLQHSEAKLFESTSDYFTRNFKKIISTAKWRAFVLENPIPGKEMFEKALASDTQDAMLI